MKLTFEQLIEKVNSKLELLMGVTTDDLPDLCYQDMYEQGMTSAQAVQDILEENGFDLGD